MGLDEELDALRHDLPDCRVAAFIDLRSRLVLMAKAAQKPRQEFLDALAQTGAQLLPVRPGALAAAVTGGDDLPDQAMILRQHAVSVFVRRAEEPSEAMCCDCAPGADVAAVLDRARTALDRVAATG